VGLAIEAYAIYNERQRAAVHSTASGSMQANGWAKPLPLEAYSAADLDVDAVSHGPDSVKAQKKKE
jgi:hypothetical protein